MLRIGPTDFSLAPIYLFNNSGPLILMKFSPHSLATAEASNVLPQPGNPYSKSLCASEIHYTVQTGVNLPRTQPKGRLGEDRSVLCGPFESLAEDILGLTKACQHTSACRRKGVLSSLPPMSAHSTSERCNFTSRRE